MGGGDLNMKKSWHPLLMKNQERVWLEEKKALEERKKLEQLRKEKEEERQLQELQRLQEEQTGRKRTEKLEWMYATPATGSGASSNDLEDYLLGKKRVDKLLVGDENQALGASHKNFIAVQHANTVRDTAAKVREDPLFIIKQQEQAALQALRENPLRLKEMQERNGLIPKPDKGEKRKRKHKHRSRSPSHREKRSRRSYSRSISPRRLEKDARYSRRENRYRHRGLRGARSYYSENGYSEDEYSPPVKDSLSDRKRTDNSLPLPHAGANRFTRGANDTTRDEQSRSDRLATMLANASEVNEERQQRLASRLAEEKAELESEQRLRAKLGDTSSFISSQQKRVFGGMDGGLGEYMRRSKIGLAVERD